MLRERIADRTAGGQAVAVARRMLTDLEMKGVLREAQASFNLCVNLRPDDNLFQECVRTFMTVAFPGSAFTQRLCRLSWRPHVWVLLRISFIQQIFKTTVK